MAMTPDKKTTDTEKSVAPLAWYFLWTDTRRGVQKLILGLMILCAILFTMDFIIHRHAKVPGEELYGFHALAGFLSFTVIVLGARMLRVFIRRDESFYAPHGVDAEEYPEQDTQRLSHGERVEDNLATLRADMMGRESSAANQSVEKSTAGDQPS